MTPEKIEAIAASIAVKPEDVEVRHRAVQDALRFFTWSHLPDGPARAVSRLCAETAGAALLLIGDDDPELTRGLSRLLEAKDAFVRAAIAVQVDGQ